MDEPELCVATTLTVNVFSGSRKSVTRTMSWPFRYTTRRPFTNTSTLTIRERRAWCRVKVNLRLSTQLRFVGGPAPGAAARSRTSATQFAWCWCPLPLAWSTTVGDPSGFGVSAGGSPADAAVARLLVEGVDERREERRLAGLVSLPVGHVHLAVRRRHRDVVVVDVVVLGPGIHPRRCRPAAAAVGRPCDHRVVGLVPRCAEAAVVPDHVDGAGARVDRGRGQPFRGALRRSAVREILGDVE